MCSSDLCSSRATGRADAGRLVGAHAPWSAPAGLAGTTRPGPDITGSGPSVMFADGTAWDIDEIYRRAHDMAGTDGNDNFSMVGNAPVIYHGLAGNDNISGRSGKDVLYGDAGDDYISGGGTLIGGPGNDNIRGSEGDDVYIFNRGDRQDLITDTGGVDTIRFGDGIRPDDIVIKRVGNGYGHNLELCIKDTDDKVAV